MNSLVAEIIAGIGNHEDEAFLGAAMVAESLYRETAHLIPPYNELIKANRPTGDEVQTLKQTLIVYVQTNQPMLASAIAALGKFNDPALVPLFREKLGQELQALLEHNRALCSLIIALDNCGERIITTGSQSHMEVDNSIAHARGYLKPFGQVFPW